MALARPAVREGTIEDEVVRYFRFASSGTCFDAGAALPHLRLTSVESACRTLRRKGVLEIVEKASKKSVPVYRISLI